MKTLSQKHAIGMAIVALAIASACTNKANSVSEPAIVTKIDQKPRLEPQVQSENLELCYANFLKTSPEAEEGNLVVTWDLNKNGDVVGTKLLQSELKDKKFTNCVIENLKKAHFPSASAYPKSVAHKFSFKRRDPAGL